MYIISIKLVTQLIWTIGLCIVDYVWGPKIATSQTEKKCTDIIVSSIAVHLCVFPPFITI